MPDQKTLCPVCGCETSFQHDHRPDNSGLDDGPKLYHARKRPTPKPREIMAGIHVRKRPDPNPDAVMAQIRARAWATRRAKYGAHGHA